MNSLEVKDSSGWYYWLFNDDRLCQSALDVLSCDSSNFIWRIRDSKGERSGEVA